MRVLIARWPSGKLASLTCGHPAGFGDQFRASFEQRGFTVQTMPESDYHAYVWPDERAEVVRPAAQPSLFREGEQSAASRVDQ